MIPIEYVCLPIGILLLVVVLAWRVEHGKHKTRTLVYRERWNVEEGFEEERS